MSWEMTPSEGIWPRDIQAVLRARVPAQLLFEGANMVEVLPPLIDASFVWAELNFGDDEGVE